MSMKNYKTIEIIYSNAFGQIEKVRNEENGLIFLMKKMNKKYLKNNSEKETLDEIEKLSAIKHQNLSAYKKIFFDDSYLYLTMEYDDESELKEKIKYNYENHLSFEENYLWSLTIQLLNLIKFIQENKNIDFNFTSLNILLMNNGLLKIYDYGKNYIKLPYNEDSWMTDFLILPPELMNGSKNIDIKAINIWKAGCIIYELCTLFPPFDGNNIKEVAKNIMEGSYKPIESKYSNDFNILISKMLVVDPLNRANIEELLSNEIIKKRNVEIDDTKVNENIFTFKKMSLKESRRQRESQNEMMQNDKYEIMKFTLSQKKDIEGNIDLISTGHFNINNNNNNNEFNKINNANDLRELILEEQAKKRIIENDNFNYNNPYRNNNANINSNINSNINNINIKKQENNIVKLKQNQNQNQKKNRNNNLNNFNKKHQNNDEKKIKLKSKNIVNDNNILNYFKKERQKTPTNASKKNNFWGDVIDNKKNINNFINDKNKDNKNNPKLMFYPQNNNNINHKENNINVIKSTNAISNKKDAREKDENIIKFFLGKKEEKKIKIKVGNERNKSKNEKRKNFPIISQMQNYQKERNADKIIGKILNKGHNHNFQNKINKNNNYGSNNIDKNVMNNNFMLKKMPIVKPANNLPNITYGKNNKIKIEYEVIKYNSYNKYKKKINN